MKGKKIRYAVVGQGSLAQVAILPAFKHARNSELTALVSGDISKLKVLGKKYGVSNLVTYDDYDALLGSGKIDAVYIVLPNNLHKDFSVRAARAGIHVLCEKPMALNVAECEEMIRAAKQTRVKLMIAYRLHLEAANLQAIAVVQSGKLGELKYFHSVNSQVVVDGNIRLDKQLGGGPVADMGIYCINAARYIFRDDPYEVAAVAVTPHKGKFKEVPETVSVILKFPKGKVASFTTSFNANSDNWFEVVGEKGTLRVENAFEYVGPRKHVLTLGSKKAKERIFNAADQFGPELFYFSDCILFNKPVEPSGFEGLADMKVIEAIRHAIASGKTVQIEGISHQMRPTPSQEIDRPAIRQPKLLRAQMPAA